MTTTEIIAIITLAFSAASLVFNMYKHFDKRRKKRKLEITVHIDAKHRKK